jgi:hypothetical protein
MLILFFVTLVLSLASNIVSITAMYRAEKTRDHANDITRQSLDLCKILDKRLKKNESMCEALYITLNALTSEEDGELVEVKETEDDSE